MFLTGKTVNEGTYLNRLYKNIGLCSKPTDYRGPYPVCKPKKLGVGLRVHPEFLYDIFSDTTNKNYKVLEISISVHWSFIKGGRRDRPELDLRNLSVAYVLNYITSTRRHQVPLPSFGVDDHLQNRFLPTLTVLKLFLNFSFLTHLFTVFSLFLYPLLPCQPTPLFFVREVS